MDLQPGTTIDRYVITEFVGRGGMAAVWKARHKQLGTLHAIKFLEVHRTALKDRLIQEGRIQASMRHINVVAATDVIEVEGSPALVLEWIEGFTLDRVLSRTPLTVEQSDDLMSGVFDGMMEVERRGLVHRDLKPGNILLSVQEGRVIPKVVDFGIAKATELESQGEATYSNISMGTPAYMAVEQFRDARSVDSRADVFSLGAILYELMTGERAFPGNNIVDIIYQITQGSYRPVRELAPELPEARIAVIERALEPDADDRFPSIAAMAEAWFHLGRPLAADWSSVVAMTAELRPAQSPLSPPPPRAPQIPALPTVDGVIVQNTPTSMTIVPAAAAVPDEVTTPPKPWRAPQTPRGTAPPRTPVPPGGPRDANSGALIAVGLSVGAIGALLIGALAAVALPQILNPKATIEAEVTGPSQGRIVIEGPQSSEAVAPAASAPKAPEPAHIAPPPVSATRKAPPQAPAVAPTTARAPAEAAPVRAAGAVPIRSLLRERRPAVLACLEPLAESDPSFSADLSLSWVVNPDGTTREARITASTVDDPDVRSCVLAAVGAWTFPAGAIVGPFSDQISVAAAP